MIPLIMNIVRVDFVLSFLVVMVIILHTIYFTVWSSMEDQNLLRMDYPFVQLFYCIYSNVLLFLCAVNIFIPLCSKYLYYYHHYYYVYYGHRFLIKPII